MLSTTSFLLNSFMLTTIMMFINQSIAMKKKNMREKASPFECGFDPLASPRLPFSTQFFLLTILFLIFDIELAIILPAPITLKYSSTQEWLFLTLYFSIIMISGLIYEWSQKSLEWTS